MLQHPADTLSAVEREVSREPPRVSIAAEQNTRQPRHLRTKRYTCKGRGGIIYMPVRNCRRRSDKLPRIDVRRAPEGGERASRCNGGIVTEAAQLPVPMPQRKP